MKRVFEKIISVQNCSIVTAYRGREEQDRAFNEGRSKARFGESKHNVMPSLAIDIIPKPINWNNIESFKTLNKNIVKIAEAEGVELIWGGDFKSFKDYPHYELKKKISK